MFKNTTKNRYQIHRKRDGMSEIVCKHCKREIEEVHEILTIMDGNWVVVGRGCADCVHILERKLAESQQYKQN